MANSKDVTVDRDFARFGNKSYAINKINSVEIRERRPYGEGAVFLWGLIALILGLMGLGSLPNVDGSTIVCLLLAALCGWLAWRAKIKSRIVDYQLFLMTSSSEAQALSSRDGEAIHRLRHRIESAMAGQLTA